MNKNTQRSIERFSKMRKVKELSNDEYTYVVIHCDDKTFRQWCSKHNVDYFDVMGYYDEWNEPSIPWYV